MTVALNSNDPLYAEIRDLHLEALGQTLNEKCVRSIRSIDCVIGWGPRWMLVRFGHHRRLWHVDSST